MPLLLGIKTISLTFIYSDRPTWQDSHYVSKPIYLMLAITRDNKSTSH